MIFYKNIFILSIFFLMLQLNTKTQCQSSISRLMIKMLQFHEKMGWQGLPPVFLLIFLAFTADFSVSPAEALKCFECANCTPPTNPTDCGPLKNRCEKLEGKKGMWRGCSTLELQERFEKKGFSCEEMGEMDGKKCYCDFDYCNFASNIHLKWAVILPPMLLIAILVTPDLTTFLMEKVLY
ncbi:unnamed protein product [Orchesella dallaii]|uniref:Protein sleepless n=1 Tax=Orchesella dallaii TaxID=48710 RepID=A0ABP1RYP0_9HEXA